MLIEGDRNLDSNELDVTANPNHNLHPQALSLPRERDHGPIEYKLKLCGLTLSVLERRCTQLLFRLNSGHCVSQYHRTAIYILGVTDEGSPIGIPRDAWLRSLKTLRRMADTVQASVCNVLVRCVRHSLASSEVNVYRHLFPGTPVATQRFLGGIRICQKSSCQNQRRICPNNPIEMHARRNPVPEDRLKARRLQDLCPVCLCRPTKDGPE